MNIYELNQIIAGLNPYDEADKPLLKFYLKARRKLLKEISKNISDILKGDNLPASLKPQSGL